MTPATARERRLALIAWFAVCLIWGTTYLGIRVSLESMPPMIMAGLRWTVAGGGLAIYMAIRGERMPSGAALRGALLLGFLMLVLGNGGVVWAELYVPSGLTAVVVAASPFWMAGVEAFRADGERMTWRTAIGLVLGFSGIVLLIWPELTHGGVGGRNFVLGMLALQLACLGWSIGSSYSKRHARADNVFSATAAQMLAGGAMMLAIGTARGEWSALSFTPRSTAAFVYLSTVGAIGGFVAYTYALRHLPVSLVSLYAYINPIIAVALGVAILGEPFTPRMAAAAALVLGGVAIVRSRVGDAQTRRPLINRTRKSTIAMTRST
ncbi:MAG TPA: EamA family transporter [Vicinamibacterales bacterium]|nr:EamA family transporter [Vicinamibacterales bacterium]